MRDLAACWNAIHKMLTIQLTEIHSTFGRRIVLENIYKCNNLYYELEGCVSIAALSFIFLGSKTLQDNQYYLKKLRLCDQDIV